MAISNSISRLQSNLSKNYGLAKPYDFRFDLTHPRYFPQTYLDDFNTVLQDVSVPSKVYSKQPVYYGGPLQNYPYIATYTGELSCTLLLRRKDNLYNQLHKWHASVIRTDTNIVDWPDEWTCKQAKLVLQYLWTGGEKITKEYTLYDVWPEAVTEIPLSQSSQNEYIRYSINFAFRYWTTEDTAITL